MQAPEIVFLHSGAVGCLHFTCAYDMCIVNVQQSCASTTKLATAHQKCWPAPLRRSSYVSSGGAASQRAEPGSAGGARLRFGLLPGIWAPATWPEWLCRIVVQPSDLTTPQKHI